MHGFYTLQFDQLYPRDARTSINYGLPKVTGKRRTFTSNRRGSIFKSRGLSRNEVFSSLPKITQNIVSTKFQ